jgi:hypothetical protein
LFIKLKNFVLNINMNLFLQWLQQHVFYAVLYMLFPGQTVLMMSRIDGTKEPFPVFISTRLDAAAGTCIDYR